jgi:hypothetical protein
VHLLVHDTDRDGWGSAALLCAALGPEQVRLLPLRNKDALRALRDINADVDQVWVLDIPAPGRWPDEPPAGLPLPLRWVDHHMATWRAPHPDWVEAILPKTNRPTTTMTVLRHAGLLDMAQSALAFTRTLCSPTPSAWGAVLDGLGRADELPLEELPGLLAAGPLGEPPPAALDRFAALAEEATGEVERRLAAAPRERHGDLLLVRLADAGGIPLKSYSLAARLGEPPETVVALAHRERLLYVGRDSRRPGLDLLAHFGARGLAPKGHSYVAFAQIPHGRMDGEIDALAAAVNGGRA